MKTIPIIIKENCPSKGIIKMTRKQYKTRGKKQLDMAQIKTEIRRDMWLSLSDIQRYRIYERRFKSEDYYHYRNAFIKNGYHFDLPSKEQFKESHERFKSKQWITYAAVANNGNLRIAGERKAKVSRKALRERNLLNRTRLFDKQLKKAGFDIPERDYNNLGDNHV